jgi:hypothetical protein
MAKPSDYDDQRTRRSRNKKTEKQRWIRVDSCSGMRGEWGGPDDPPAPLRLPLRLGPRSVPCEDTNPLKTRRTGQRLVLANDSSTPETGVQRLGTRPLSYPGAYRGRANIVAPPSRQGHSPQRTRVSWCKTSMEINPQNGSISDPYVGLAPIPLVDRQRPHGNRTSSFAPPRWRSRRRSHRFAQSTRRGCRAGQCERSRPGRRRRSFRRSPV